MDDDLQDIAKNRSNQKMRSAAGRSSDRGTEAMVCGDFVAAGVSPAGFEISRDVEKNRRRDAGATKSSTLVWGLGSVGFLGTGYFVDGW